MNPFSFSLPDNVEQAPITTFYSFNGELRVCEVRETKEKEGVIYKCRLLPSTLEISIFRAGDEDHLTWLHTKGIVNDLAQAIGEAIEQHPRFGYVYTHKAA
jgi:hypothetical protein